MKISDEHSSQIIITWDLHCWSKTSSCHSFQTCATVYTITFYPTQHIFNCSILSNIRHTENYSVTNRQNFNFGKFWTKKFWAKIGKIWQKFFFQNWPQWKRPLNFTDLSGELEFESRLEWEKCYQNSFLTLHRCIKSIAECLKSRKSVSNLKMTKM